MSENIQEMQESVDLLSVLLWQFDHEDGDSIESLLKDKGLWYTTQVDGFWDEWYRDVFDIRTCTAFGLQVWANVLGIAFEVPDCPGKVLSFDQKKLMVLLRFDQLTLRPTTTNINEQLARHFGAGAYALDSLDMSPIMYYFKSQPPESLALLLTKYDLLLRPSTVGRGYRVFRYKPFGFGPYNQNFGNGTFYSGDQLVNYGWDIAMWYDAGTGYVTGRLDVEDTSQSVAGRKITIIYTSGKDGSKVSNTVTTGSDGTFTDTKTPEKGRWTAVGKIQIQTPICTTVDVQSPLVSFNKVVYEFAMSLAYSEANKQVGGVITCSEPGLDLSGQSVILTYTPDAANGEGTTDISHTVLTTSNGSYVDANTPSSGRYTVSAKCDIAIAAEGASGSVSAGPVTFTNVEYVYTLSIEFDSATPAIRGKLTCNQPAPSVSNVSINLYYSEPNGIKNISRYVRTNSKGEFVDTRVPVGLPYKVRASTSMQGPFEQTAQSVVSPQISFQIPVNWTLNIEYTEKDTIDGQLLCDPAGPTLGNIMVTLTYTPTSGADIIRYVTTASDGTFSDSDLPSGGTYDVVATASFKASYGGSVNVKSDIVGYSNVPPGAQFIMTPTFTTKPMFCIATSELSNILIDYGDGKGAGKEFTFTESTVPGYGLVYPTANAPLQVKSTITVTGSHTIRFINETGVNRASMAPLHELIYVASSARISIFNLAPYSNITRIHPTCFDNLPNLQDTYAAFARCSLLVTIEQGLFSKNKKIISGRALCSNCINLTTIPTDLFGASKDIIEDLSENFVRCVKLRANINEVFPGPYPECDYVNTIFGYDERVTGSGLTLIEAFPNVTTTTSALQNCKGLSDYAKVPKSWGGPPGNV